MPWAQLSQQAVKTAPVSLWWLRWLTWHQVCCISSFLKNLVWPSWKNICLSLITWSLPLPLSLCPAWISSLSPMTNELVCHSHPRGGVLLTEYSCLVQASNHLNSSITLQARGRKVCFTRTSSRETILCCLINHLGWWDETSNLCFIK